MHETLILAVGPASVTTSVGGEQGCFDPLIQSIEVGVGEDGTDDPALWYAA